jgi:hypothetical protein
MPEMPAHAEQEVATAGVPRSWPKATGGKQEVAPGGWRSILKYLQNCH